MKEFTLLCVSVLGIILTSAEKYKIPDIEPEILDELLNEKRYDEFSILMGIKNSSLVDPDSGNHTDTDFPLMHDGLQFGDILVDAEDELEEEGRQGLRFDKNRNLKWPNGIVPFVISEAYSESATRKILDAIKVWNSKVKCVKFVPRNQETAYVMFFSGRGCYSSLGHRGRQQPISLKEPGCIWPGVILHEMEHSIGFSHEQNRWDRDNYIRILWGNIPERWKSQYRKTNPNDYGLQRNYDFYSLMHYGIEVPGMHKKAFEVLNKGVNTKLIGQRDTFTETDLNKIKDLYC